MRTAVRAVDGDVVQAAATVQVRAWTSMLPHPNPASRRSSLCTAHRIYLGDNLMHHITCANGCSSTLHMCPSVAQLSV